MNRASAARPSLMILSSCLLSTGRALRRVLRRPFLHASAATKLVNVATNLAAIGLLASLGFVNWPLGLAMMVANIAGSQYGSKLAIRHGSTFVRKTFLIVVSALIAKSAYDAFFLK